MLRAGVSLDTCATAQSQKTADSEENQLFVPIPLALLHAAIQEGYDLATGAVAVGAEGGVAGALGDAVLRGPQDCTGVVSVSGHIGEGIHDVGGGSLLAAP